MLTCTYRYLTLACLFLLSLPSMGMAQISDLTVYSIPSPNPQTLPSLQVRESIVLEPTGGHILHARVYETAGCTGLFSSQAQYVLNQTNSNLVPMPQCPSGLALYNIISTPMGTIFRHICPTQPSVGTLDLRQFYNGQYGTLQNLNYVTAGRC